MTQVCDERTYEYSPNLLMLILGMTILYGLSIAAVYIGVTNEKAVKLFGIVFSADFVNFSMWIGAIFAFYAGCKAAFTLIKSWGGPRSIRFTKESITAPPSIASSDCVTVDFDDIHHLQLKKVSGKLFLHIHHHDGEMVIPSGVMKSEQLFQELIAKLKLAIYAKGENSTLANDMQPLDPEQNALNRLYK